MAESRIHLGDGATFAGQRYVLHGVAESLADLLQFALTLRDLDTMRLVIAPIAGQGYGVWCQGLECCLEHQEEVQHVE